MTKLNDSEKEAMVKPLLVAASAASGFSQERILSRSRQIPLPFVRYMLFYTLYDSQMWSTAEVGRIFGRDHATVVHGMREYQAVISGSYIGYEVENTINDNFQRLIMQPNREHRIRGYMNDIRRIIKDLPEGTQIKIGNKLDRISLELKKDRPEYRRKHRIGL